MPDLKVGGMIDLPVAFAAVQLCNFLSGETTGGRIHTYLASASQSISVQTGMQNWDAQISKLQIQLLQSTLQLVLKLSLLVN